MQHGHASICFSFSQNPMEFSQGMRTGFMEVAYTHKLQKLGMNLTINSFKMIK